MASTPPFTGRVPFPASVVTYRAQSLQIPRDTIRIGICATNTARKDWGFGGRDLRHPETTRPQDLRTGPTNTLLGDWALMQLFDEFGILENAILETLEFTEDEMARWYSCCNVTLGIGSGEGFGYPWRNRRHAGCRSFIGNYGGGMEIVDLRALVPSTGYRYEGYGSSRRPIFEASDWADFVEEWHAQHTNSWLRTSHGMILAVLGNAG